MNNELEIKLFYFRWAKVGQKRLNGNLFINKKSLFGD
jgi:hypothetical protein